MAEGLGDLTASAPQHVDGWAGFSEVGTYTGDVLKESGTVTGFKWLGRGRRA